MIQLILQCPWLSKSPPLLDLPLHFSAPFSIQYKLHTAHCRKFVNILVQGLTPVGRPFHLQNVHVHLADGTFKNRCLNQLELKSLNKLGCVLVSLDFLLSDRRRTEN